ncbi:YaiI/YqxD family protein [Urbifossiella limnaea]|uniref:UPF0178 protein ETAA1_41800 n=1 Tax=Urbifossiella limnaea TaxID=2528023 RepID=A0A517XXL0_9BACT|nr:YaiI/YqxD family protein [Urbifossiella limnaea]QDU22203.1 hypothetical protein ETAA1_41800 [Urbifossiella limnaea]
MPTLYLDADACPVKDEAYRVAARYTVLTVVVANSHMRVPAGPLVELVVRTGFGAADDHIAEVCGPGDVVVTADIPLAGRALLKGARVLDPRGREITDNEIGAALGMRELMEELRARGEASGGPSPMSAKDRSRFLGKLDEVLVAVRRGR